MGNMTSKPNIRDSPLPCPCQCPPVSKPPSQPSPPRSKPPSQPSPQSKSPSQPSPRSTPPSQPSLPRSKPPSQPSPRSKSPSQPSPRSTPPSQPSPPRSKPPSQPSPPRSKPPSQPSPQSKSPSQPSPRSTPPSWPSPPRSKPPTQPLPRSKPSPQPHSRSSPLPTSDRDQELLPYTSRQQPQASSLTRSPATHLSSWNTQTSPFSTDGSCLVYVPLTTADLFKWKMQFPSFSTNPSSLISLMESIFSIYCPSWDDCQDILAVFFTSQERSRILTGAVKAFVRMNTGRGRWRAEEADCFLPPFRWSPDWNKRTEEGRRALSNYHKALLEGMKLATRKPTDFLKVMCTRQGPKESPLQFLERLLEVFREYTPIDPDDPVNFKEFNQTFVDHSASDIRNAIQRVYGFEDMTRFELLKIAQSVFDNRESEEVMIIKTVVNAVMNSQLFYGNFNHRQRPQRLRRDQCAYCKRLGHWKHECPNRRQVCPHWGQF
ncbi:protein transport protein SEC24-like [Apodemus sylvaticus]|uniref:protein transport protein SEC24-like n=1 Tax=Apodemus sylvaticus TaxID=10129 RepID=UPI002241E891|nr:protein transport protein SEC24-like [Apodemus sylvaticus]